MANSINMHLLKISPTQHEFRTLIQQTKSKSKIYILDFIKISFMPCMYRCMCKGVKKAKVILKIDLNKDEILRL